jgi:hypothetical protein
MELFLRRTPVLLDNYAVIDILNKPFCKQERFFTEKQSLLYGFLSLYDLMG